MADGFNLILQDYCSYCGEFVPEVERTDNTSLEDKSERYVTDIRCKNEYKCHRLAEKLRKN